MHELFLHFIWQLQYFNKNGLKTVQGEDLQVLRPGIINTHAGPDFSNSKIRIGDMAWAGTVEIHMKASDWNVHRHHRDKSYDNVILHVVWQNDKPIIREDGTEMPTLELKGRIEHSMILQYRKLMTSGFTIPCSQSFEKVPEIIKLDMLEKALLQRLGKKSAEILDIFKKNGKDWEETTYQLLARNFGFKINADPFFQLARCIPYKYLIRHIDHPHQIEGLLFGQAGFLERNVNDEYHRKLQKEYRFLSAKYELSSARLDASQWKFLRMRPANFPTLRLAQFCDLLIRQRHLFSRILEADDYKTMFGLFEAEQRDYWKSHYTFGSSVKRTISKLGPSSIDNILVNTVAPLMVAYGKDRDDQSFVERAEKLLQRIPGEENNILKSWGDLGWKVQSAFDSQGLIELYNIYCVPRRCLQCSIGSALLKPGV